MRVFKLPAITVALIALSPASAHAAVALGDYVCSSYSSYGAQAAGSIQIVGDAAYTINRGSQGAFSHDTATNIVTFSSGDYQSFYGVYVAEKEVIEIRDKADGFYLWTCNFQAGSGAQYAGAKSAPAPAPSPAPAPAPAPSAPAASGPAQGAGPAIGVRFPKRVKLLPSLSNGFVVTIALDRPAALTGTVKLSANDARRYRLGKRSVVVARAKEPLRGTASGLEFKPSKRIARKLRRAKRLRLSLTVVARDAAGAKSRKTSTISLTR